MGGTDRAVVWGAVPTPGINSQLSECVPKHQGVGAGPRVVLCMERGCLLRTWHRCYLMWIDPGAAFIEHPLPGDFSTDKETEAQRG